MAEDALVFQLAGDVRPGASIELTHRVPVDCTLTHLDVRLRTKTTARIIVSAVRTNPIRSTLSLAMLAGDEFVITIDCVPGNDADTQSVRVTVAATATMRA